MGLPSFLPSSVDTAKKSGVGAVKRAPGKEGATSLSLLLFLRL